LIQPVWTVKTWSTLKVKRAGCAWLKAVWVETRRKDDEKITRIISARRASRKERKKYEVEED
jgi:uncharacterized DUF497 family protein